ncbi:hypothetical protein E3T35_06885 [Cryobacterium sp. TMT1-2-2]|nr:hypothetical protein E3T35_06885 [Cryobacterium sp. TMT1-2-2]
MVDVDVITPDASGEDIDLLSVGGLLTRRYARVADQLALPPLSGHPTKENVHMGKTRREFTPGYKDEAVKLVINTGRAIANVARELGINEASLGRWVSTFKAHNDTAGLIRLDKFSEHDWLVLRDNFRHRVRP